MVNHLPQCLQTPCCSAEPCYWCPAGHRSCLHSTRGRRQSAERTCEHVPRRQLQQSYLQQKEVREKRGDYWFPCRMQGQYKASSQHCATFSSQNIRLVLALECEHPFYGRQPLRLWQCPPALSFKATGMLSWREELPIPSWPTSFKPQHIRPPPLDTAQVWLLPAAIAVKAKPAIDGYGWRMLSSGSL